MVRASGDKVGPLIVAIPCKLRWKGRPSIRRSRSSGINSDLAVDLDNLVSITSRIDDEVWVGAQR